MDTERDIIGIFLFETVSFVGTNLQRGLQALQKDHQAARRSRIGPQRNATPKKTQVAFHSMWPLTAISSSERQSRPDYRGPSRLALAFDRTTTCGRTYKAEDLKLRPNLEHIQCPRWDTMSSSIAVSIMKLAVINVTPGHMTQNM